MLSLKYGLLLTFCCVKTSGNQRPSQSLIGTDCILASTGGQGECKLVTDCNTSSGNFQNCGYLYMESHVICCPKRRPGEISRQKCKEYSKYIMIQRQAPVIGDPPIIRNECGHKVVELIVGGKAASRKEFPHMARIGYELIPGNIKWACGGSLISENYILTAAHCLSSKHFGPAKYVRLGVSDLTSQSRYKQDIKVAEYIPHPEYRSWSIDHDIALIKLDKSAEMNPYARPACLHLNPELTETKAIATGWGHTETGKRSNDLLKVTLDLFDFDYCKSTFSNLTSISLNQKIVNDLHVCAGSKNDEAKDTCQGDSGGPLQIYHTGDAQCMYDIVGITSFGIACQGRLGIYTRVSHYVEWIENIVWP